MRYKIKIETDKKLVAEPEVTLTFEREPDGSVNVMADGWYILTFETSGKIKRCGSVPSGIGFKVDEKGHVLTTKEI